MRQFNNSEYFFFVFFAIGDIQVDVSNFPIIFVIFLFPNITQFSTIGIYRHMMYG